MLKIAKKIKGNEVVKVLRGRLPWCLEETRKARRRPQRAKYWKQQSFFTIITSTHNPKSKNPKMWTWKKKKEKNWDKKGKGGTFKWVYAFYNVDRVSVLWRVKKGFILGGNTKKGWLARKYRNDWVSCRD